MEGQSVNNTKLEAEEERLREKLKRRRRTDEKSTEDDSHNSHNYTTDIRQATASSSASSSDPKNSAVSMHRPKSESHSRPREGSSSSRGREEKPEDYSPSSRGGGSGGRREGRRMSRDARSRGDGGRPYPPPHYRGRGPPPGRWERGPPRGYYQDRGIPPPGYRGGPRGGPPPPRGEYDYSGYGGGRRPRSPRDRHPRMRGRSRSRSSSSRSSSASVSSDDGGASRSRSRSHQRRASSRSVERGVGGRVSHRDRRSGSGRRGGAGGSRGSWSSGRRSRHSRSPSTSSASSSSSSSEEDVLDINEPESPFSKDQRTVFVSQLVMRTREKDIRRYFRKKLGCHVKEVILLRDKRTGSHKGCAYVQFGRIEDVNKAVSVAGQPPDFQRFPILVKASEAEKNYVISASSSVLTASMMGTSPAATSKPILTVDGKMIEAQKVYIGSLDPSVTDEHIFALFSQFGQLEKVSLQMDPATNTSRGYAFLSYRDPKEANLAIQTMSNQVLAGRAIKTGWASQTSTIQGVDIVISEEFPSDAAERAKKALAVLAQMSGVSHTAITNAAISATAEKALDAALAGVPANISAAARPTSGVPTVAEARETMALQPPANALPVVPAATVKLIGGQETPTQYVLVHNMFDKDQETGEDWPTEIKEEFEEECSKFGKINSIVVVSTEPGGKIFVTFETVEAANQCANNLAGRWFDKRQLRVDFMLEDEMPKTD